MHSQDVPSLNESRSLCQTGEVKLWTCSIFNCSSIADALDYCGLICLLGTFHSLYSSVLVFLCPLVLRQKWISLDILFSLSLEVSLILSHLPRLWHLLLSGGYPDKHLSSLWGSPEHRPLIYCHHNWSANCLQHCGCCLSLSVNLLLQLSLNLPSLTNSQHTWTPTWGTNFTHKLFHVCRSTYKLSFKKFGTASRAIFICLFCIIFAFLHLRLVQIILNP